MNTIASERPQGVSQEVVLHPGGISDTITFDREAQIQGLTIKG